MRAAINAAESNKTPFGAVLAMGDEIFATASNQTKNKKDPTSHAEIEVIRKLSEQIQKTDLSGFTLYTTCEPCPICMSAVIRAGIQAVVYGCGIPLVTKYMEQMDIRAEEIAGESSKEIELHCDFMKKECELLLRKYS